MKQNRLTAITLNFAFNFAIGLAFTLLNPTDSALAVTTLPTPKKQQTRGAYRAELDRLLQENKAACKVSFDCVAVPLGEKACGGPTEYVVMSQATQKKIADAISDLTKMITQLDHEAHSGGIAGTCDVVEKPELACRAGTCAAANGK